MRFLFLQVLSAICAYAAFGGVSYKADSATGGIGRIEIDGDARAMNWIVAADNSQYKWIGREWTWGLGRFFISENGERKKYGWGKPVEFSADGAKSVSVYRAGDIEIKVVRDNADGDIFESYTFKNLGKNNASLQDLSINTPFNDNYPDPETCMRARANAHIWASGGAGSYVEAVHMSGAAPHLGLVLCKGALKGYEIFERGKNKGSSNTRGIIALMSEDIELAPDESKTLSWRLFSHSGGADFEKNLKARGAAVASCPSYVLELGETAEVRFEFDKELQNPRVLLNGKDIAFEKSDGAISARAKMNTLGDSVFELCGGGKVAARAVCRTVSDFDSILARRAKFILQNQRMNDAKDPRFGAFMVYDNSEKKIYLNDGERKSNDTDEGAERLGMGIFLAKFCQNNPDPETLAALECYAKFLREKLQDESFKTWSSVSKTTRNRYFNYPWVARFYAEIYALTKDPKYLHWAYGTMKSMYAQFGHGKYILDTPARLMIGQMRANPEFAEEEKSLMADFEKVAQIFMKNGCAYPKQEVNFEQTIVCPAASHLMQMYFLTEDKKYLTAAGEHIRVLDAFAGRQPDWRLNGIAVRHWDGYWFGKSRMWGDVFPHYWASLNAPVYKMYAEALGDKSRALLADAITRAALCNIFEDGSASCAYVYPDKVDGQPRRVWDAFANDQDWAAVFYLDVADK